MNEKSTTVGAHSNGVWHRPDIRPTTNWNGDFPPGTPLVNMYDREDLGYGPRWKAAQRAAELTATEAEPATVTAVTDAAAEVAVAATVEAPEGVTVVTTGETALAVAADVSAYTGAAVAAASFNAPVPAATAK